MTTEVWDAVVEATTLAKLFKLSIAVVKYTKILNSIYFHTNGEWQTQDYTQICYTYIVNTTFDRFCKHPSGCYKGMQKIGVVDKKGVYHARKIKTNTKRN